jgi:hypothetical protein
MPLLGIQENTDAHESLHKQRRLNDHDALDVRNHIYLRHYSQFNLSGHGRSSKGRIRNSSIDESI